MAVLDRYFHFCRSHVYPKGQFWCLKPF